MERWGQSEIFGGPGLCVPACPEINHKSGEMCSRKVDAFSDKCRHHSLRHQTPDHGIPLSNV